MMEAFAPAWLVLPIAFIALTFVFAHLNVLWGARGRIPESRRRIRIANDIVIAVTIPLMAWVFARATTDEPRAFVLGWSIVIGLLAIILALACADAANTARIYRSKRRVLNEQIAELRGAIARHSGAVNDRLRYVDGDE